MGNTSDLRRDVGATHCFQGALAPLFAYVKKQPEMVAAESSREQRHSSLSAFAV